MDIFIDIAICIVILTIGGIFVYKAIQNASKKKIEGLEREAEILLENAKKKKLKLSKKNQF